MDITIQYHTIQYNTYNAIPQAHINQQVQSRMTTEALLNAAIKQASDAKEAQCMYVCMIGYTYSYID